MNNLIVNGNPSAAKAQTQLQMDQSRTMQPLEQLVSGTQSSQNLPFTDCSLQAQPRQDSAVLGQSTKSHHKRVPVSKLKMSRSIPRHTTKRKSMQEGLLMPQSQAGKPLKHTNFFSQACG